MPKKVILDVDTGTDDAIAIMLAALHPSLDLVGVTTVNGNVSVETATDNTLRVVDLLEAAVPVYEGCARPIVRKDFPTPRAVRDFAAHAHGTSLPLPEPKSEKQRAHAVEYLIETYRSTTDDIALVPVGPLTNIAAAVVLDRKFVERVPELVIMGGTHALANITPSVSFNTWADADAAASVLDAGFRKITLVPLDATHSAPLSLEDCAALRALGTPAGRAAADLVERRIYGASGERLNSPLPSPVHDALCVAHLIDDTILGTKYVHVAVETRGELTFGRTVIDVFNKGGGQPNCHVAFHASRSKYVELLLTTFGPRL